jgi:hypothetical protein
MGSHLSAETPLITPTWIVMLLTGCSSRLTPS